MPRRVVDSLALIVSRYEVPNFAFCRDRETARMAAAEDEVAHFDAIADRRTADMQDQKQLRHCVEALRVALPRPIRGVVQVSLM